MSNPDLNTVLLTLFGVAGWVWNAMKTWGVKSWQHRAMWEEYAERHDIPSNGKEH